MEGVKLVTLAPELEGGVEAVKGLAKMGVVASIGHTECTIDQVCCVAFTTYCTTI